MQSPISVYKYLDLGLVSGFLHSLQVLCELGEAEDFPPRLGVGGHLLFGSVCQPATFTYGVFDEGCCAAGAGFLPVLIDVSSWFL